MKTILFVISACLCVCNSINASNGMNQYFKHSKGSNNVYKAKNLNEEVGHYLKTQYEKDIDATLSAMQDSELLDEFFKYVKFNCSDNDIDVKNYLLPNIEDAFVNKDNNYNQDINYQEILINIELVKEMAKINIQNTTFKEVLKLVLTRLILRRDICDACINNANVIANITNMANEDGCSYQCIFDFLGELICNYKGSNINKYIDSIAKKYTNDNAQQNDTNNAKHCVNVFSAIYSNLFIFKWNDSFEFTSHSNKFINAVAIALATDKNHAFNCAYERDNSKIFSKNVVKTNNDVFCHELIHCFHELYADQIIKEYDENNMCAILCDLIVKQLRIKNSSNFNGDKWGNKYSELIAINGFFHIKNQLFLSFLSENSYTAKVSQDSINNIVDIIYTNNRIDKSITNMNNKTIQEDENETNIQQNTYIAPNIAPNNHASFEDQITSNSPNEEQQSYKLDLGSQSSSRCAIKSAKREYGPDNNRQYSDNQNLTHYRMSHIDCNDLEYNVSDIEAFIQAGDIYKINYIEQGD